MFWASPCMVCKMFSVKDFTTGGSQLFKDAVVPMIYRCSLLDNCFFVACMVLANWKLVPLVC